MAAAEAARRLLGPAQRLAVRSGRGPLGRVWPHAYTAVERRIAARLLRGAPGSAYVRGGTGRDQPLWGISDIDLFLVVPGHPERGRARAEILERWSRLRRRVPGIEAIVSVGVYEEEDLAEAVRGTYLTHGLDQPDDAPLADRALYYEGRPGSDDAWLRARPGLFGALRDWRLVSGPEARPPVPEQTDDERLVAAWGDLQHWWLFAFARCVDPGHFTTPYLAAKLIVEPLRILLWLEHREAFWRRPEVISAALQRYPDEREALELARGLIADPLLPRGSRAELVGRETLDRVFPHFVRLSGEVAQCVERLAGADRDEVELLGAAAAPAEGLPLCDWRGLCVRHAADEPMSMIGSTPEPGVIAAAIEDFGSGPTPVLGGPRLLVLPAPQGASQIRRIAGSLSDPVSSALIAGRTSARYPRVRGFALADVARRAVAERRAQLASSGREPSPQRVELLLCAARAALLARSVDAATPQLALTSGAIREELQRAGLETSGFAATREGAVGPGWSGAAVESLERCVAELIDTARERTA